MNNFKDLINYYLFKPLENKNEQVCGYLYASFIKKLYDNFRSFNEGFFMIDVLKEMEFHPGIRSEILEILIQNTRDFLKEYLNTSMYGGVATSQ